jgi:hypothetical protein
LPRQRKIKSNNNTSSQENKQERTKEIETWENEASKQEKKERKKERKGG